MIPCSRNMIQIAVAVLRFLGEYNGSMEQIAEEVGTTVASVRRAIDALRKMVPIEHVRYDAHGERIDEWRLNRALQDGEAEVIAVSLFMDATDAQALFKRARVVDVEPYRP